MERENGVPEVAYIMSRFPVLTETFILYEMQALEQQGVKVRLCPLLREPADVMHPEALAWVEKAEYRPILSWGILLVKLQFLLREPVAYLGTLWSLLRGTWGSLNFFVGGLAIFPKTVHLAQSLSNAGVQHVHAHFANHPAAAAFIIHRLTGIPYSFTAHGSDLHVDRHMLREKVAEAARVVAISDYNKDLILSECGEQYRDKVMVIHCGVDTQVFQPRAARTREGRGRAARGRSPGAGPFTILCTGTLHEVKGQTYLINACQLLNERGMSFRCYLVGEGPDQAALTRQVEKAGLSGQVCLLGQRTRVQIAELLTAADVVVAPSVPTRSGRREGIPVVLMEAMASGGPGVAGGISGIPEVVEHGQSGLL